MDRYLRFSNTAKGVCFVMRAYERLLDYVKVYTTSDPESGTHPSAAREFDLAHKLVEELKALGVEDAHVDEHCYVYGSLPATPGCEEKPALGLIAHMDTAPDASGENVNPILHENYDGGDVVLPASGKVMQVCCNLGLQWTRAQLGQKEHMDTAELIRNYPVNMVLKVETYPDEMIDRDRYPDIADFTKVTM